MNESLSVTVNRGCGLSQAVATNRVSPRFSGSASLDCFCFFLGFLEKRGDRYLEHVCEFVERDESQVLFADFDSGHPLNGSLHGFGEVRLGHSLLAQLSDSTTDCSDYVFIYLLLRHVHLLITEPTLIRLGSTTRRLQRELRALCSKQAWAVYLRLEEQVNERTFTLAELLTATRDP